MASSVHRSDPRDEVNVNWMLFQFELAVWSLFGAEHLLLSLPNNCLTIGAAVFINTVCGF